MSAALAIAESRVDLLDAFAERAAARAYLFGAGAMELAEAVDVLQHDAERGGLVKRTGQDAIHKIIAAAFSRYREAAIMNAGAQPLPSEAAERECNTCGRAPCPTPSFCRACRIADALAAQQRRQQRRTPEPRPTPQVTIEAVLYCVRSRGVAALQEPENIERLSRCDDAAIAEIERRLRKYTGNDNAS